MPVATAERAVNNELNLGHCHLVLDGRDAPVEVMDAVQVVEVEQSLYLPAMFVIRVSDPELKWFDTDTFKVGSEVKILMAHDQNTLPLLSGEITTLELDASPRGVPSITVRGYDRLHRLQRGRKTRAFIQKSVGDVVKDLAKETGMHPGNFDTGQVYDYILQNNETNYEFLQRWTHQLGLELVAEDKKLELRLRRPTGVATTLEWGLNLTHFVCRLSSHEQVDEVVVRGWDAKTKAALVGTANSSTFQPQIGETRTGKAMANQAFGAARVASVYRTVNNQAEADKVAQAIFDDLAGRFIQIEGEGLGEPHLAAGKQVEIKSLGQRYSGKYYVTACTHHYSKDEGYVIRFEASGRQTHSLLELVGSRPNQSGGGSLPAGPVVGIVTNNKDPEERGRVKVKLPWLPLNEGREIESDWARIVSPMAGKNVGFFFLPEVNDEVLIAFEQGDPARPYVLGMLWNGVDEPPGRASQIVGQSGKVEERVLRSRAGHLLSFNDSDKTPQITLTDKSGKNKLVIDTNTNTITVESGEGNLVLKANQGTITLDAQEIKLKAAVRAVIEGGTLFEAKAAMIKLN